MGHRGWARQRWGVGGVGSSLGAEPGVNLRAKGSFAVTGAPQEGDRVATVRGRNWGGAVGVGRSSHRLESG